MASKSPWGTLSVHLTLDHRKALMATAKRFGISMSAVMRLLIERCLPVLEEELAKTHRKPKRRPFARRRTYWPGRVKPPKSLAS